jgi:hypothetical protein
MGVQPSPSRHLRPAPARPSAHGTALAPTISVPRRRSSGEMATRISDETRCIGAHGTIKAA